MDERTETPGAVTSGLSCSEYGVGPREEKLAMTSAATWRAGGGAAAAIAAPAVPARGALPGALTAPLPASPSFPAAMQGTTPARAAPSIALMTMSRDGSI